jgi:arylsulfatase A-like enzyme
MKSCTANGTRRVLVLLWLAPLLTVASCSSKSQDSPPVEASRAAPLPPVELSEASNILIISVDTLRPDHMSLYGYSRSTTPEVDKFFAKAEIYERAYSAEANTTPSVVSMLSGLYPSRHRLRLFYQRLEPNVYLLSDYLEAAGYQTAAIVSNFVLTSEATGLSTRFETYDDFVTERELRREVYERRASRTTDAAIKWLDRGRNPERPHLLWVHYIDPHAPYFPPPEEMKQDFLHKGHHELDMARVPPEVRLPDVRDALEYVDRYDEEISYVDHQIGRLLRHHKVLRLTDAAIVVFAADHGEALLEHGRYFSHGYQVWESIMRVPLAILRPGAEAKRISTPVSLVDLTPTLLTYVGYPLPSGLDGIPLEQRRPTDLLSLEATGWGELQHRAVVQGRKKWYATANLDVEIVDQRYTDLERDPYERRLEPRTDGTPVDTLESWFRNDPDPAGRPKAMMSGVRLDGPKVAPGRSESELDALRALGYVE